MRGWYKASTNWPLSPACISISKIIVERVALYTCMLPLDKDITLGIDTYTINNSVPHGGKSEWEFFHIFRHRSGGPSQIRVDSLQGWLAAAT